MKNEFNVNCKSIHLAVKGQDELKLSVDQLLNQCDCVYLKRIRNGDFDGIAEQIKANTIPYSSLDFDRNILKIFDLISFMDVRMKTNPSKIKVYEDAIDKLYKIRSILREDGNSLNV